MTPNELLEPFEEHPSELQRRLSEGLIIPESMVKKCPATYDPDPMVAPPGCHWEQGIVVTIPERTDHDNTGKILVTIPDHRTEPLSGWRDDSVPRTHYRFDGYTLTYERERFKKRRARIQARTS
jgi:hypothetical protein